MKALEIIRRFKYLGKNESTYSINGDTKPSTSYLLRSFKQGQIKIDGKRVAPDIEIEDFYTVKFRNRTCF